MQVKRLRCHLSSLNIPFQLCSKLALSIITSKEDNGPLKEVVGFSKEVIGSSEEVIGSSKEVKRSSKDV